jgi:hypothetical protein
MVSFDSASVRRLLVATDAKPYLVPGAETCGFHDWEVLRQGEWSALPDALDDWAPGTDLSLRRVINLDIGAAREQMRLPASSPLNVAVSWLESKYGMRGEVARLRLEASGAQSLEVTLPGDEIGGVLSIRTTLSLGESWQAPPGVAAWAGSIVQDDVVRIRLQGTAGLFPVSIVDFAHTHHDPDASWHLVSSTELEAPFLGKFLLQINSRDTELVSAIGAVKRDGRQQLLLEELHHQVARVMMQVARQAQQQHELLERDDWPADSVGDVLSRLLLSAGLDETMTDNDWAEMNTAFSAAARRAGYGRPLG